MKDFIIVFSIFIGNQGNGYIFKDNGLVSFSEDIKMMRTDMVCL